MSYTIDTTNGYSLAGDYHYLVWEDTPTKPGYYWAKDSDGEKQMVEVYEIAGELCVYVMGTGSPHYLSSFVSWLGPIPEPIE